MSREVEKGKEEDPNDIDKMPVETGNFDRHVAPVIKKESAEEKHLGGEKDPYAKLGRFMLLLEIVERLGKDAAGGDLSHEQAEIVAKRCLALAKPQFGQ